MKSDIDIKDSLYALIKTLSGGDGKTLPDSVSGRMYKDFRPINSSVEDIVISILDGGRGQIQEFTANVNIYVPDIRRGNEFIENTVRLRVLASLAIEILEHINDGNLLVDMQSQRCMPVEDIHFHCINNRLRIKVAN